MSAQRQLDEIMLQRDEYHGVQEVTEKYFLASDGSRHTNYADAYKATVSYKLTEIIAHKRHGHTSQELAREILKEFTVSLPRK